MRHVRQATLAGQFHLAMDAQLQRQTMVAIRLPANSTEQRTLRKFMGKTRECRHIGLRFPRLGILAKTPWFNFYWL
ncbi:MAG: hypothetical protein R6W97_13175 [Thiobacillus sp.]